jgi:hypothetical protein
VYLGPSARGETYQPSQFSRKCPFFGSCRRKHGSCGLRGGAGRTRTGSQTVMSSESATAAPSQGTFSSAMTIDPRSSSSGGGDRRQANWHARETMCECPLGRSARQSAGGVVGSVTTRTIGGNSVHSAGVGKGGSAPTRIPDRATSMVTRPRAIQRRVWPYAPLREASKAGCAPLI